MAVVARGFAEAILLDRRMLLCFRIANLILLGKLYSVRAFDIVRNPLATGHEKNIFKS
jgi:hypothetical protein